MLDPIQKIECNKDGITNFIKFCQTIHRFSLNPISVFHLSYTNYTSCRIEINRDDPSKFDLIYFTELNNSFLQSYLYDQYTNFENWNPLTESAFFRYFNKEIFGFLINPDTDHFWENELNFHGDMNWNQLLAMYTINKQRNETTINSVCLQIEYFFDTLNSTKEVVDSHFAVLRSKRSDVIFTSDLGIIDFLGFEDNTYVPLFPPLSGINSTFWAMVSTALSGKEYGEVALINTTDEQWKDLIKQDKEWKDDLDGSRYVAVKTRVTSTTVNSRFEVVSVIKLDETISNYFFAPTVVFVCLWAFLAFVYIFSRIILKYAINRYQSNKIEIINSSSSLIDSNLPIKKKEETNSFIEFNTSTIYKIINKIRNFQISVSDDIDVNKEYDEIVSELAQPKERLFSVSVNKDCKFCSSLIQRNSTFSNKNNSSRNILGSSAFSTSSSAQKTSKSKKNEKSNEGQTYEIWKILSKQFYFRVDQIPNWKIIKNDPEKSLIFAYLDVIQRFDLTIPEFDPDVLIQFSIEISTKYVSTHFYTIYIFHYLSRLLKGPFNNWLIQKIDIFILFFLVFTKDIVIDLSNDYSAQIKNSKNDDSLMQKKYLIFNDNYSQTERKLEFIFSVFYKFFPCCAKNKYFEENVRDIFYGIQNFNRNDLFSTFHYRIQSPDFNVHSDILDRRLFIKAILCLSSQWPYFSTEELMFKSLKNLNSIIFDNLNNLDEPNFIPSYHYYYSKIFVKPWVELFHQFSSLTDLIDNINNTILYWKQVKESANNLEGEY